MARKNPAKLVNPEEVVRKVTDNALGIPTLRDLDRRLSGVERALSLLTQSLDTATLPQAFASMESLLGVLEFIVPGILCNYAIKGSATPTAVTSTTPTTIVSCSVGPTIKGVKYRRILIGGGACNSDAAGFIFGGARIGASGTTFDGMTTGTVSGERLLLAAYTDEATGDGASVNFAYRSRLSLAGAGSVNDAGVLGIMIPTQFAVLT